MFSLSSNCLLRNYLSFHFLECIGWFMLYLKVVQLMSHLIIPEHFFHWHAHWMVWCKHIQTHPCHGASVCLPAWLTLMNLPGSINLSDDESEMCELNEQKHYVGSMWHPFLAPNGFDKCVSCSCMVSEPLRYWPPGVVCVFVLSPLVLFLCECCFSFIIWDGF